MDLPAYISTGLNNLHSKINKYIFILIVFWKWNKNGSNVKEVRLLHFFDQFAFNYLWICDLIKSDMRNCD